MTSVDEFFRSLREVFARNRQADWPRIGLMLGVAVVVTIALSAGLRHWRARRQDAAAIDAAATAARLTGTDLEYLKGIAAAAGLRVLEVMTSLAPFEHATAVALASEAPPLRPAEGSAFDRVRRLRKALGFSPLSPHLWLLSTRELVDGDRIGVGGASGQVVEVNEASFAVELPWSAAPVPGASIPLTIDRPDDARYLVRVRVLSVEPPAGASPSGRAFFAHDEQPDRQQHREYVRVRIQGTVTVIVEPAAPMDGTLVDVSAGGVALDLPTPLAGPVRRGAQLRCSFTLGEGERFEALPALVVAAGAGPRAGEQHLRLSFTSLAGVVRDRLAAAVARHQLRAPPQAG
jgi:hypothetical protein